MQETQTFPYVTKKNLRNSTFNNIDNNKMLKKKFIQGVQRL